MRGTKDFGLLAVYKPAGPTSTEVLNFVKKRFNIKKIGHTGTLDPFAEGVLIFLLGKATRLAEYYQKLPKRYIATGLLGVDTDTYDITGKVLQEKRIPPITEDELKGVLKNFTGRIEQVPPPFSAKKVKGKRAYLLARKGKKVELKPVKVNIYEIKLLEFNPPRFTIEVSVSGGTYIRSLIRDIALSLGTVGTTEKLKRVAVGSITEEECIPFEKLKELEDLDEYIRRPDEGLKNLKSLKLAKEQLEKFRSGQILPIEDGRLTAEDEGETVRVLDSRGNFIGIGRFTEKGLKPEKVFIF